MTENKTINLQNHFLIAMPSLQDPWFNKSVVYICEHNHNGAMGIVINKPIEKCTIEMVLNNLKTELSQQKKISINLNYPIFSGGPLLDDRGFILHTPKSGFKSSVKISTHIMITTSQDILKTLGTPEQPENILIALGYSGWTQGQLEQELIQNNWITAPANEIILFHTAVMNRWNAAAKLLGFDIYNITNQTGHA